MTPCLSIRELYIQREKNGTRFSLSVPELDIFSKQTLVILGSSGCGKSTLLDMLALILCPTKAKYFSFYRKTHKKIDLFTATSSTLADLRRKSIGYVLQSGGLLSFISVKDNILLPGRLAGDSENELHKRLKYLVKELDLEGHLNKHPQHLSGGQRQRVAIARALALQPLLIFADEPTAAVDQINSKKICKIFKKLTLDLNIALVIVSHDEELMRPLADRIVNIKVQTNIDEHVHSLASYENIKECIA